MKNNANLIKLFDCTQIAEGLPIYEGTCSKCGTKVQVVESWVAVRMANESHNVGLKKGLLLGIGSTLLCGALLWANRKLVSDED